MRQSADSAVTELVARALVNKGVTLRSIGLTEHAAAAYHDVVRRFGDRTEVPLVEAVARALIHEAIDLARKGQFDRAKESLDDALSRLDAIDRVSGDIAVFPLTEPRVESEWRRIIPLLVAMYKEHSALGHLGVGLVRSIPTFSSDSRHDDAIVRWLEIWKEASGNHEEMAIPLRILTAAAAKQKTGNDAALQQLPAEERAVLDQLLQTG